MTSVAQTLDFQTDPMADDIAAIHQGTSLYTAAATINTLLDQLEWPANRERLLDPGAGNGGFVVAALQRLDLKVDDYPSAVDRVKGYEFYGPAVAEARRAVAEHLGARGWSDALAHQAAHSIIEERDYLLDEVPHGYFQVIASNPPYWRYSNLGLKYREAFIAAVAEHARADLLYAYLDRSVEIIAPGGRLGLITADRWLINRGSAALRSKIGQRFSVVDAQRLDPASSFYVAKTRRKNTPPRVHPVSLILTPSQSGQPLTVEPFRIDGPEAIDGVALTDLVDIRISPWLGPDGIFVVDDPTGLPADCLIPVVEPRDIAVGLAEQEPTKWAIATTRERMPSTAVMDHLDTNMHLMPKRGLKFPTWVPPESFEGKLPLAQDAVVVPRISKSLRGVRLPAGRLPINHQLVVVSGLDPDCIIAMLEHPAVQAQADAMAHRIDGGYHSYTTTLLRALIIPHEAVRAASELRQCG